MCIRDSHLGDPLGSAMALSLSRVTTTNISQQCAMFVSIATQPFMFDNVSKPVTPVWSIQTQSSMHAVESLATLSHNYLEL
eukprot:3850985-Amphidinium_carterae.1